MAMGSMMPWSTNIEKSKQPQSTVLNVRPIALFITQIVHMKCLVTLLLACCVSVTAINAADYQIKTRSIDGKPVIVPGDSAVTLSVVCFLGAECPMARSYAVRLSQMAEEFELQGVRFIGVNSNRQDSIADIREYADSLSVSFPVVHDRNNIIADNYGAVRTPEVFVVDSKMQLRYQGRIDDQYAPGIVRTTATRQDLRIAITEVLAEQTVTVAKTTALGCIIGKISPQADRKVVENDITFNQHVSRVLQKHCVECHRNGEIGPFSMDNYGEVAGWSETIIETINNGRMPPWHADSNHGDFANSRHMPEVDKQIIRDWIAGGLKEGDSSLSPTPAEYIEGWQLDKQPDQIVEMRERPYVVPRSGTVEYQYFVVDPGFTEDKWITAAQVIPGDRSIVHHAIVFVRPPDGSEFRGVSWLSAYVPGQRMISLPSGRARKIPAGSKLVFQMHYTPNGTEAEDITSIGLQFCREEEVTHEIYTLIALNQEFEIPPNASSHIVKARVPKLPPHVELLAVTPHMHYRGKSFRLFGAEDDSQTLLNVPEYDFNWQHTYFLTEPIPVANLGALRFEATFDNSSENPFNPDPREWVTWGDQTWEEMAVAFFVVSEPRGKSKLATRSITHQTPAVKTSRQRKIDAYVDRVFEKMDANGDGRITQAEAPIVVRRFTEFSTYDLNGDDVATKAEVVRVAEDIFP